jgi:hypothetical protein
VVTTSHGTILVYYERYGRGHRRDKLRVVRTYNENVKGKLFQARDLV